ncbi:dihydropteroate synthase [Natrarchaeobius chitinivorans]|uniref:Probable bifunctional folylpolyglutamate synthase/dihydropteroate synthase n=1 Tax=Natrarchaeobius chitinivorans TaxID=1679083 RepID=A0A3N6PCS8_NATCH|nr:dihydropteroate synthase [Natrarchaeobius chitinivorans]RQG97339.1 dihydropteroate synthase [Natrarchaeobius chitinivorans]
MEYHEAINRLERLRRLRPEMGTDATEAMLAEIGNPQEELVAVQIAGSNGKGSTARLLDRILRESGATVGCYTSPDLNDRRERITVDGRKIPKAEVVDFVEAIWPHVIERSTESKAPTFFEVLTAMALWHFEREGVDVAVLEVGIGGRYDATSVVDPVAAAVTSVSLEHTDILGSTVAEIARDKAQVAPGDAPLVTGATGEALSEIRRETDVVTVGPAGESDSGTARASGDSIDASDSVPDVRVKEGGMVTKTMSSVSIVGPEWEIRSRIPLLGSHQAVNAGIAATLARQVADPSTDDITAGIRNVRWPGRFELVGDEPLSILDGAHNPDACSTVATLLERFEYDDLHLVFGALREKDVPGMCRALPESDRVYLASPDVERARGTDSLAAIFDDQTDATIDRYESVLVALDRALRTADPSDCVLVTGSLSVVAEARDRWTRSIRSVRTSTREQARRVLTQADVPAARHRNCVDRIPRRTVRVHVRHDEAAELRTLMASLGGTCAVSGVEATDQHVEVVLAGTIAQFKTLTARLRGRAIGGRRLAEQLTNAVGLGSDDSSGEYPWASETAVMGILNVTPDSFHDGGEYDAVEDAVVRAEEMVAAGADVIDVGGESTRPGAEPISAETERERVLPVLDRLDGLDATISIDTHKPSVAEAALDAGAEMVNDVTGLTDSRVREVVAEYDVPAVLMHSPSVPVDPDRRYVSHDVVEDVLETLTERIILAERAGIDRSQLIVDPGLGFGTTPSQSFELLDRLAEFRALGTPLMVGHSRKSMLESVTHPEGDRLAPTIAATTLAAERGVDLVRVHDVEPNAAAIATAQRTEFRR